MTTLQRFRTSLLDVVEASRYSAFIKCLPRYDVVAEMATVDYLLQQVQSPRVLEYILEDLDITSPYYPVVALALRAKLP